MDSLIATGHVTRGYLGVMIQNINPALEKEFGLKDANGALIGDVVAGGPADKAGLKPGDVVTEYNGKKVLDSRHLQLAVAETKPGTEVPMEVLRDGKTKSIEVKVQQLRGKDEQLAESGSEKSNDTGTLNGVAVGDLDQQSRQQFNIPKDVRGAVVTEVDPNSAAAEAGIKPGAVIEEINRHPVKDANDAVRLTEKTENKKTLVRVWSDGGSHYVVVDESQNEKAG
jgi:serine protease Do